MSKNFLINLSILILLNLLIKPFWIFGIDRSVQNAVGPEAYGIYFSVFNLSLLFTIFLDLGITSYNTRNIAQSGHLLHDYFCSLVILRFLLAFLYMLVTFSIAFWAGYDGLHFKMLFFLTFNQFLLSFILYLRSNLSGLQMFKTDSFLSVLDRSLMIIICSILLWGGWSQAPFQMEWFIYAQTTSCIITAVVVASIVVHKAELKKARMNFSILITVVKESLPFALLYLLMTLYNRIDSVMLERLHEQGARQAGIYASAFRLLDVMNNFSLLFAGLLLPMFSKMIKNNESVIPLVKLAFSLLAVPCVILSISAYFYGTDIMSALYPIHEAEMLECYRERIQASVQIFHVFMSCAVAVSITYIFGTLLTANGNLKYLNMLAFAAAIIHILLNILLIPEFGAVGSAYVSLGSQVFTASIQVLLAAKIFGMPIHYRFLSSILLYVVLVIILHVFIQTFHHHWVLSFTITLAASLLCALALRLIDLKKIYKY